MSGRDHALGILREALGRDPYYHTDMTVSVTRATNDGGLRHGKFLGILRDERGDYCAVVRFPAESGGYDGCVELESVHPSRIQPFRGSL
jgi:hypothetical protein